jgi:serine/threonine protein kinase
MPQPQGSFGIQLQGYQVLKELPRSSCRTRTYCIRPRLHDDLPRYMASEETCYVLKCMAITGAGQKAKSRGAANESQVLREMSALLKLRHSNLVPCHKVFLQDGRVCTMMGSMDAGSLEDVIAGLSKGLSGVKEFKDASAPPDVARFESRLIWHFVIQAIEAVEVLHKCSIIHRALKPSNLLLEPETCFTHTEFKWRLRISDVAVPELLRRDTSKIPASKLRYMAPELLASSSPYDCKVNLPKDARSPRLVPTFPTQRATHKRRLVS